MGNNGIARLICGDVSVIDQKGEAVHLKVGELDS